MISVVTSWTPKFVTDLVLLSLSRFNNCFGQNYPVLIQILTKADMSRKLGAKLLEKLSETARKEAKRDEQSEPVPRKKIKICLDLTAIPRETPEEILKNVLKSSSQQDKNFEYLKFRKNLPKLLPSVHTDLVQLVRRELQIQNVDVDEEQLNPAGSEPLLPALGNKLGQSLERILAPPVVKCLMCTKDLTKNNPPVQVSLLTTNGPSLASKYSWRCRDCLDSRGAQGFFAFFVRIL